MNLVFIIENGKVIGGGDYAQFKYAEYLSKLGHNVAIFAANYNKLLEDIPKRSNLRIWFRHEIPKFVKGIGRVNKLWNKLYTRFYVDKYVRDNANHIDYIIGYLRESAIKAETLGKKYRIRVVNFIFENPEWMKHQLGQRFLNEYKGKFKKSWEATKEVYLRTDILIPNSQLTRKKCEMWLNRKIDEHIYPGVEAIELNNGIEEENQIIYTGRLNEYKNVNEIIEALSKSEANAKLVVVGSGEEESKLRSLAKKLKVNCEFKGNLTDSQKFEEIQKSMFMVFPSSFEGFGMPPAEALICGKPCICSDLGIFKEVYKDKVEYFKEHDIQDLSNKILFLTSNQRYRKKRGLEGRKYVMSNFTWQKSAKKIEGLLKGHLRNGN